MTWVAAVSASVAGTAGAIQYYKGQKLAKANKRPKYEVPQGIKDNLSQAQQMALEGLPPEQKQQYVENVQRQENAGLNALGDRSAGLAGIATLTQQGNDANKNLLSMDSQARQTNLNNLMGARSEEAGYSDKQFQLNKLLPFQQTAAAAEALKGAGLQNIAGGMKSAGQAIGNAKMAKSNESSSSSVAQGQGLSASNAQQTQGFGNAPQRTDTLNQYQIAKLSNPNLSYLDFIKSQGG